MSAEIESAVSEYLTAQHVKFTVSYQGVKKKALGGTSDMDRWDCEFSSSRGMEQFEFFTGLGLRKLPVRDSKPVPPHPASVLYCMLSDADALNQSFFDWCDNYGYDNDSRSAERTYQACCKIGEKLRHVFSRPQIEAISEMLQDY